MPHTINRRQFLQGVAAAMMTTAYGQPAHADQSHRFFNGSNRRIGLQLYTLGDLPREDLDGVLARVAAIGYLDIELPGLYGRSPAEVRASAERAGLSVSGLHMAPTPGLDREPLRLQDDLSKIADYVGELGVSQVVVPMAPFPSNFQRPKDNSNFLEILSHSFVEAGEDYWKKLAAFLNEKALALKPAGITLGYHNHNFEFAPIGATSGWEILVRDTDPDLVAFEIDTGWAGAAGLDPAAFLRKLEGRVRWLHLKDLKPSTAENYALSMEPVEIGDGKLDWPAILDAAGETGVKHYYVEQEPPFALPRMESITRSHDYLSRLGSE